MSQRKELTKRINQILDRHINNMDHGSPDSPNIVHGGMGVPMGGMCEGGPCDGHLGGGALTDFLTQLARGVPLPVLLAKLRLKGKGWFKKGYHPSKGLEKVFGHGGSYRSDKMAMGGCNGMPCEACGGGPISSILGMIGLGATGGAIDLDGGSLSSMLGMFGLGGADDGVNLTSDSQSRADRKMADQLERQMVTDLKADEASPPPEIMLSGGATKRARKPRGPLNPEHRAKLDEGRKQFQAFMRSVKEKGMTHKEALALHRKLKAESGGRWYDDFAKGFMAPIKAATSILPAVLPFVL